MTPEESAEILKLASAVGGYGARMDAMEAARKEARLEDHEWRESIAADISDIKGCLTEIPCMVDAKVKACRNEREKATHDAEADATRRHALAALAVDWRTWAAFLIAAAGVLYGILR